MKHRLIIFFSVFILMVVIPFIAMGSEKSGTAVMAAYNKNEKINTEPQNFWLMKILIKNIAIIKKQEYREK